jgi:hypothetical protein
MVAKARITRKLNFIALTRTRDAGELLKAFLWNAGVIDSVIRSDASDASFT